MCMLFNSAENFNYHTDQILVLKITPIEMKATKCYEHTEEKGVYNRIHSLLENGLIFLWIINKDSQSCTVKKKHDAKFRYVFHLVNTVCIHRILNKTFKNIKLKNLMIH